jgi:hypothetical protein
MIENVRDGKDMYFSSVVHQQFVMIENVRDGKDMYFSSVVKLFSAILFKDDRCANGTAVVHELSLSVTPLHSWREMVGKVGGLKMVVVEIPFVDFTCPTLQPSGQSTVDELLKRVVEQAHLMGTAYAAGDYAESSLLARSVMENLQKALEFELGHNKDTFEARLSVFVDSIQPLGKGDPAFDKRRRMLELLQKINHEEFHSSRVGTRAAVAYIAVSLLPLLQHSHHCCNNFTSGSSSLWPRRSSQNPLLWPALKPTP